MTVLTINNDNSTPNILAPLPIAIKAADGAQLAGIYYPCSNPTSAVLICAGTGIGQKSYADFAQWLNKEGFAVLTFDYRGVGESLFGMHVEKSQAKQHEWGQLDMTAALAHMHSRHADLPLHIIGHNVAAVLMGLMNNHSLISGAVSIGESALYVPQVTGISRTAADLFFRFYVPFCASWFGYVPLKCLGFGQDISASVAKQWAHWSLKPGHIRNSFGDDIKKHFYREFRSPILVLCIDGNATANQANIEGLSDLYRSAVIDYKKIVPADYGFKKIEHFNFFKPKYEKLWPIVADWLKAPERQTIRTMVLKLNPQPEIRVLPEHDPVSKVCASIRLSEHQTVFINTTHKKDKEIKSC